MSNIKISEFSYVSKTGFTVNDLLVLVNYQLPSGTTVNTTITDIKEYVLSGVTDFTITTYSDLKSLYDTSALTTTHYIISDFETVYDQPDFDGSGTPKSSVDTNVGINEPLVVFATSESTLSKTVYSLLYPEDTIEYDITFTETEVMNKSAKGRITLRVDELGNSTNYDYRNVVFKRYETSTGSGIFTEVNDNGEAYIDTIPTFDSGCYNIKINNIYNPLGYGGWGFILPNNIFGMGCRDISTGDDFYNNTFGLTCYSITFGDNCYNNIIGNSSFNNIIGNNFNTNRIGEDFKNNHILNGFRDNFIGNSFEDNTIASGFRVNIIPNNFNKNIIGYDFYSNNSIGDYFESNKIGNYFSNNVNIGNNFTNNVINDNFSANDIGDDFSGWFIQNNFSGETVASSSQNYTVIETLSDGFVVSDKGKLKNTSIITESGDTITVNGDLEVTGNTVVQSGLTASTFNISSTPNTNTDATSVLVRNTTTGEIENKTINNLLDTPNVVTVSLSGGSADFTSIKSAVDSVTGASSTNPWVVKVGPGKYFEDPITMKSYVAVIGEGSITSIVEANDPNQSLFIGADQSFISDLQIQGCTGTGVSAII